MNTAMNIDSVKINTALIMMREWMLWEFHIQFDIHNRAPVGGCPIHKLQYIWDKEKDKSKNMAPEITVSEN